MTPARALRRALRACQRKKRYLARPGATAYPCIFSSHGVLHWHNRKEPDNGR